jgi:hypothetical protein
VIGRDWPKSDWLLWPERVAEAEIPHPTFAPLKLLNKLVLSRSAKILGFAPSTVLAE